MNALTKKTATLVASAVIALTFSCSSGVSGGDEPSSSSVTTEGSSSSINISSSSDDILGSSSSLNISSSSDDVLGSSSSINISSSSDDVLGSSSSETEAGTSSSSLDDVVSSSSSILSSSSVGESSSSEVPLSSSSVAVVKTALVTEITAAGTAKTGATVSTNGEDIEPTKYWVTQAAMDALTTAITAAETVKNNENATQAQVDTAKETLTGAISTFTTAKQLGVETTAAKTALGTAITNANNAKAGVVTATNGANLFTDEFWVTSAQMTAITTAISNAQTVNGKANATKAEVEAAKATLEAAISTFNTAKQAGSVTKCGNRTDIYNPDIYECKPSINPNGIYLKSKPIDPDGNEYEAVLIGEQVWMAENLNYNADGSKCYANCTTYGRLYDWATAMAEAASSTANPSGVQGVCPNGWHLPSDAEWDVLMTSVGGDATVGTKLKAAEGWNSYASIPVGTDEYGFAGLPGGFGISDGSFGNAGISGFWWSATENDATNAYGRGMYYGYESVDRDYDDKTAALFSVRCVKD